MEDSQLSKILENSLAASVSEWSCIGQILK